MTLRVKSSSLRVTCILLQFHYSSMFVASYLMKLNVIITCFVFLFSMRYLATLVFLSFIFLSQFHFVERKNRINVTYDKFHFLSVNESSSSKPG